ncbi:uncharacterized protein LOC122507538 [Leptopilina heterotoma]|uniref:uncharacterized protein LOC122507538 n=1 Tax=Leptopilina heterotoma TaxID=63436 RepID=UPI001CA87FC8|nr:uncharacterized protein LOC122507538 [Leptopilina heterotoma]XP_043476240.1 uncharacterized protein LOC122507538 [Leptopilina heterotoma]
MACCVPGCKTSYKDRTSNKLSLFTPTIEAQKKEWERILGEKTTRKEWKNSYKICELHFSENLIERERNIFKRNGIVLKEVRKRPILSTNAVPSIFPDTMMQKESKVRLNDYCVKMSHDVFLESIKNSSTESVFCDKTNNQSLNHSHSKKNDKVLKRKLNDETENCTIVKERKIGNLFEEVFRELKENSTIFENFRSNLWFTNYIEAELVSFNMWKEDFSGILKNIVLHKDSKVLVHINGKTIHLPEMENLSEMSSFQKLLKKVVQINPCSGIQEEIGDNCVGYVERNKMGRPALRCEPCLKEHANAIRRIPEKWKAMKSKKL